MDIDDIARRARQTFPELPPDSELLQQHALRLLSAARARDEHVSADTDQAMRAALLVRLVEVSEPSGHSVDRLSESSRSAVGVITEEDLRSLVARAFSAPVDGSSARARTLAARAWLLVKQATDHLGFWQRWRLRRRARRLIEEQQRRLAE